MVQDKAFTRKDYITGAILLLVLPPVWWILYFILAGPRNRKIPRVYFFFALSLFFAYLAPVYDVISTIGQVHYFTPLSIEYLISMKTSVVAMYYITQATGCQSLNLYHLFYFITLYSIYITYTRTSGDEKYSVLFTVCTMSLVSLISLTFSTMAAAVCCLMISRNYMSVFKLFILIILCALIHKGFLIILLPAILLVQFINKGKTGIAWIGLTFMMVVLFYAFNNLQGLINILMGFDASGYMSFKANEYMGTGIWGSGYDLDDSLSKRLLSFLQYIYILYAFVISIKYKNLITNKWLLALFWVNVVILGSTIQFYVISERFCISAMIFSSLILACVYKKINNYKRLQAISLALSFIFLLSVYQVSPPIYRSPLVGSKADANSITKKTLYMPTFLLLDIGDFGFTDKYIATKSTIQ